MQQYSQDTAKQLQNMVKGKAHQNSSIGNNPFAVDSSGSKNSQLANFGYKMSVGESN